MAAQTMRAAVRRLPLLAWLTVVWLLLWEDASVANVVGGLAVGASVVALFPAAGPARFGRVRPLAAAWLAVYFLWKLLEANLVVAWEVVTPNNESVNLGIVAVPLVADSDAVITLVANAITLTPGTLTLEVRRDPPTLYVHVLHLRSIDRVREDVRKLELLALRAFGSADAVRRAQSGVETPGLERDTGASPWSS